MNKAATMLIERWSPVTHDFGLIQAPVDRAAGDLLQWHRAFGHPCDRKAITGGLGAALTALEPFSPAHPRQLFVPTRSEWTAFYQNGTQGSDPAAMMCLLAMRLEVLAMRVCSVPPPPRRRPAVVWEVYAPPELGGYHGRRRLVSTEAQKHAWVFAQDGMPFPFECVEAYAAPDPRDRFPPELLEAYLGHLGITPFDDAFFVVDEDHPAVLIDCGPDHRFPREYTLQEVLDGVPWQGTDADEPAG